MKLHLGCGLDPRKGYVNIDMNPEVSFPDRILDIQKPLPYNDNTVDEILAIHMIEHISHQKIVGVFKDWVRILKPGGKADIECPNFPELIRKWLMFPDWGDWSTYHGIFGGQRDRGAFHLAGYSYEILEKILLEAGFTKVDKGGSEYPGGEKIAPTKGIEDGRDWNIRVVAWK